MDADSPKERGDPTQERFLDKIFDMTAVTRKQVATVHRVATKVEVSKMQFLGVAVGLRVDMENAGSSGPGAPQTVEVSEVEILVVLHRQG